ncbi:MAG: sugar phosphate isomerase/epimerase [Saprospiraceae bacterium]|nr:sugar phosphate isomerase/epimerase [Saprospiraceae bacterium]
MAFHQNIVCAYLYSITKYGYPPPAADTIKYLEEMANMGFRSIELEGIRDQHLTEMHEQRYEIRDALQRLSLNLPVYCTVLPSLSSQDEVTKEKQLHLFELGCQTAQVLGAKIILDNGPLPPYQFPGDIPVSRHYEHQLLSEATIDDDFEWNAFWQSLITTLQKACDIAGRYKCDYLVHPAFGVLGATPEAFLHLAKEVNRQNFGYNFDTSNLIALKCNLSLALHQLKSHIKYVHVSDNSGTKNEHIELGRGIINWSTFFKDLSQINYRGYIGIDIGGDESDVPNLDQAYITAAKLLTREYYHSQISG